MNAVLEFTGEVCIGSTELIPAGEGRRFLVGGERVAVFHGRDGAYYAVQDECPHRGGPLSDGITASGQVVCPYHSYRFHLGTGECANDATCSLRTYPVREDGGLLMLTVE